MTDDEIEASLIKQYGKGFKIKLLEVIRREKMKAVIILYRVKCIRDGAIEWRCKGQGATGGWDYVTRIKF